jgi:hypothetical protein
MHLRWPARLRRRQLLGGPAVAAAGDRTDSHMGKKHTLSLAPIGKRRCQDNEQNEGEGAHQGYDPI